MATLDEFASVMRYLEAGVGLKEQAPEKQVAVYFDLLIDLPGDVLRRAAQAALLEHNYPTLPPVGVIRRHAVALMAPPALPVADAWGAVKRFAEQWHPWLIDGLPTHDPTLARYRKAYAALPEAARRAAEAYGWPAVCQVDPGVAFAQFRSCYESQAVGDRREAMLPPAPAVASLVNGIGRMPALAGGRS